MDLNHLQLWIFQQIKMLHHLFNLFKILRCNMWQKVLAFIKNKVTWVVGGIVAIWYLWNKHEQIEGILDNLKDNKEVSTTNAEIQVQQTQLNEEAAKRAIIEQNMKKEENEVLTPDQLADFFNNNDSPNNQ